jgi:hypothetical protein
MALALNGSDSKVVRTAVLHGTKTYAVFLRAKFNSLTVGDDFLGHADTSGANLRFFVGLSQVDPSKVEVRAQWSSAIGVWETTDSVLVTGAWTSISVYYDGNATGNAPVIFVNNVQKTITLKTAPSGTYTSDTRAWTLGDVGGGTDALDGTVADFAVWNRNLAGAEHEILHRLGPLWIPDALQLYWPGWELPAAGVSDFSGNGLTGTPTSVVLADDDPTPYIATPAGIWGTYGIGVPTLSIVDAAPMVFEAHSPSLSQLHHRRRMIASAAKLGRFLSVALERTGDASEFELHAVHLKVMLRALRRWVDF